MCIKKHRRPHPRCGFQRNDERSQRSEAWRRGASARLLPQSDRREPDAGPVEDGRRAFAGNGGGAADRPGLSGLRRRAGRRCGGDAAGRVQPARDADRGQLLEELRYLPRADGHTDGDIGQSQGQPVTQGTLAFLNQNFSFPPDHGARLVTMILSDQDLTADWKAELEEMRRTMLGLREQPVRIRSLAQLCRQLFSQSQHRQAHLFQFRLPVGGKVLIAKDHRHQPRAMIGREGKVLPVQKRQCALRHRLSFGTVRYRHQYARPLAVDTEVLRATGRDQRLWQAGRDQPRRRRIFVQPVAEALIGQVDQRHRPRFLQMPDDRLPLVQRQVRAGRIVAAAVQKHHVARLQIFEIAHHSVEIHIAGVVVDAF